MEKTLALSRLERTRRFWRAHGRTWAHLTVLHAFSNNPTVAWNPEGLSLWYGLRVDRATDLVGEFARCGVVEPVPGRSERYTWNHALDWAIPRSRAGRTVVQERWAAEA